MTDTTIDTTEVRQGDIDLMAKAGFHFGALRSKRHPSTRDMTYGTKGLIEVVDLEKSQASLDEIKNFVRSLGEAGKQILLVGTKNEAKGAIARAADSLPQPSVTNRWIGGTLTNTDEIKKRVDKLVDWEGQDSRGELAKYTKKERLLISKEVADLKRKFEGIKDMKQMPGAMLVIDSGKESIAVMEAKQMHVPIIAFSSTDCDISVVDYAVVGNDRSVPSIEFVVSEMVQAYKEGRVKGSA